jgi:hypothetical protein
MLFGALAIVGAAHAQLTVSALSMFNGGTGWVQPLGTTAAPLSTGGTGRGMAYNAATGNLYVVDRTVVQGGTPNNVWILNGSTGAVQTGINNGVFALPSTGVTNPVTGGTFLINKIGVSDDGKIYLTNLNTAVGAASPGKIHKWNNEASAIGSTGPDALISLGTPNGMRLGDTLDVIGSGNNTRLDTGFNLAAGPAGYKVIEDNGSFTQTDVTITGIGNTEGRLGVGFLDPNTVIIKAPSNNMRLTTFTPGNTAGTLVASPAVTSAGESASDFAVVNGVPILAMMDMNNSVVRFYDMTNASAPVLMTVNGSPQGFTTTTGTLNGNGNATGEVKWGAISGSTATLYAMSSNQGLQAFTINVVPESASMIALGLGAVALIRRRRPAK